MKYLIFFFGLTLCAMATAQVRVPDFTYGGSRYTGLTATLIDTDTVELRTAAGQTTRLRWGLTPGDVQKALAPARDGLLAKVPAEGSDVARRARGAVRHQGPLRTARGAC